MNETARQQVEIYTDGGCEPNPGAGGYGVVLLHPKSKQRKEANGGFRLTTNNRMEILAAIAGLEMLKQPCHVTLYSDSQYLVKAMMEGWVANWKTNGSSLFSVEWTNRRGHPGGMPDGSRSLSVSDTFGACPIRIRTPEGYQS